MSGVFGGRVEVNEYQIYLATFSLVAELKTVTGGYC
jgi:hypothetical protein